MDGIQRLGIRHGGLVLPVSGRIIRGVQWLTDDDNWAQPWATQHIVHCDRSETRFSVVIPKSARKHLFPWRYLREGLSEKDVAELEMTPGGEHWWLYFGNIPAGWIRGLEQRPVGILRTVTVS